MSELTSFLMNITILIILACNQITAFALRLRIEELECQVKKLTEGINDGEDIQSADE
jgi:hypothetical protein